LCCELVVVGVEVDLSLLEEFAQVPVGLCSGIDEGFWVAGALATIEAVGGESYFVQAVEHACARAHLVNYGWHGAA
jgi:hypothetical protein